MDLAPQLIFIPVLAHLFLVFGLYIKLGIEKSKAVKAGQVNRADAALDPSAWPESVLKVSNNINNQFQVPVLFYALALMIFVTDNTTSLIIVYMGLFVLTRYVHAYIHVTSNYVPYRLKAFTIGTVSLLVLSIWLFSVIL
jgi:hypothetical protein